MANNIALDIDHMLAFHMVKDISQANFFHRKGAILSSTTLKTHYIYPGVIELIKVLFNEEFLNVSIFSKGISKRNREFVALLLKKALPEPEYDDKRSQTRVFSRDALDGAKKNLITVLREGDVIENAALIDDRPENAASGQEYNLLQVPITDWEDFDRLTEKLEYYDATGTRFLKCVINLTGSCDLEENSVEEGRKIFIYRNKGHFEIKFIDSKNEVRIEKLSYLENPQLVEDLIYQYSLGKSSGEETHIIEDKETVLGICRFIGSFKGRTRKICRRANRICYVTGLLFAALSYAKEKDVSLSQALFIHQSKNGVYQPDFKNDRLYLQGLAKLKSVNPNFGLITPSNYQLHNQVPESEEECTLLQNALNNEFNIY